MEEGFNPKKTMPENNTVFLEKIQKYGIHE